MEQKSDSLQTSESPHSISQLPELSSSLSIPSEPPDIRNLFSSYVYESPDLSSDAGLVASLLKESKCRDHSSVPHGEYETEEDCSAGFRNVGETGRVGIIERADSNLSAESEVPESLQAETQLSEPPDIRNWFSSSVYESPDLGSDVGFVASTLKESKFRNHGFVPEGENEKVEENLVGFSNAGETGRAGVVEKADSNLSVESEISVVPDSLRSETQLSEPSDIRNLFSSYVYESPLLPIDLGEYTHKEIGHSGDGCVDERSNEEQAFGGNKHEKDWNIFSMNDGEMPCCDELATGSKSSFANKQDYDQYLLKSADSSVTYSQLSEPPHLSNLFSSYVYDSPELNAADGFRESFVSQKESQEAVLTAQGSNRDELEDLSYACAKIHETDLRGKLGSSNRGCKDAKQAPNPPCQEQDELPQKENLSAQDMVSMENSGSRVALKSDRFPQVSLEGSLLSKSGPKESLKQNSKASQADSVDEPPTCNPILRSCRNENKFVDTNSNGFVSVKKRISRSSISNDSRRPRSVLSECSSMKRTASPVSVEDCIKRKPLSETTNLQAHLDVSGSAGKWKCPRKSKPDLGPPMKQLRLEKWVHLIRK